MKPKKIRITNKNKCSFLREGEVFDVIKWHPNSGNPQIEFMDNTFGHLLDHEWEPVSEFNHGDPVWAWDYKKRYKKGGFYLCNSFLEKTNIYVVEVENEGEIWTEMFRHVEHRKPQITLQELADKADVNLNEVEIVE